MPAEMAIWSVTWEHYPKGQRQPLIDGFYTEEDAWRCAAWLAEHGRVGLEVIPQTIDLTPEELARMDRVRMRVWERIQGVLAERAVRRGLEMDRRCAECSKTVAEMVG